jgi:hypothetical protein
VPAENRVGLDNRRDFLQSLLAKLMAKLREGFAFAVAQPDAPCELVAQDAILCGEILVTQQQFLIDSPGDIRQQVLPVHRLSPEASTVHIASEYA